MNKSILRNSLPFLLNRQLSGQLQRADEILTHKSASEADRQRTLTLLKTRAEREFLTNFNVSYFQRVAASLVIGQLGLHTIGITKLELRGPNEPWTVVGSFLGKSIASFLTNIIPEEKLQFYAPVLFATEVFADLTRFCYELKVVYPRSGIVADVAPVMLTPMAAGILEFTVKYMASEGHNLRSIGTREQIESSMVGIYGSLARILVDTLILLGVKGLKLDFGSARNKKLKEMDQELKVILTDDFEYVVYPATP